MGPLKSVSFEFSRWVGLPKETILPYHIRPLGGSWSCWKHNEFINISHSFGFLYCKILHSLTAYFNLSSDISEREHSWQWWYGSQNIKCCPYNFGMKACQNNKPYFAINELQPHNFAALKISVWWYRLIQIGKCFFSMFN